MLFILSFKYLIEYSNLSAYNFISDTNYHVYKIDQFKLNITRRNLKIAMCTKHVL